MSKKPAKTTKRAKAKKPVIKRIKGLTTKEIALLTKVKKGMDVPGEGWLHELTIEKSQITTKGVAGSLVKKGLISCDEDADGGSWVVMTDAGEKALSGFEQSAPAAPTRPKSEAPARPTQPTSLLGRALAALQNGPAKVKDLLQAAIADGWEATKGGKTPDRTLAAALQRAAKQGLVTNDKGLWSLA